MTENEALEELKTFPVNCLDFKENQALQVAIKALEEIQAYKNGDCMNECEHYDNCANYIYSKGYNKAIDEFAEKLKYELNGNIIPDKEKFTYAVKQQEQICHQNTTLKRAIKYVEYIAGQMKGGE